MISVVAPIFNEQDILEELVRRLGTALEQTHQTWEIILVDDGSTDASAAVVRKLHQGDGRIKLLGLSRNFGHQPAVTAGVHHARGDCVVLIDGDLQDPPEVIPEMVRQWQAGSQVVLGERNGRAEQGPRSWGLKLFYPLLRRMSDIPSGPDAGIFSLMDRVVVEQFNRLPERKRFIPGLRSWLGFRQSCVSYRRQERHGGAPKQSLGRLIGYAMDAIFSFSYKPLRWVAYIGFMVSAAAFALAIYYFVTFFAFHKQAGSGFTTIILCVLFLGGVQLISVGILGQYIARIYEEIKQRPLYVVREAVGFEPSTAEKDL